MSRPAVQSAPGSKEHRDTMSKGTRYLSIKQFCQELDVAQSTFHDWRAKGLAPRCYKLPNGQIRIRRTDFDVWLASRELPEAAA